MMLLKERVAARLKAFCAEDDGASLIEYSILIGLITALVVAIIFVIATALGLRWENLNTALT